ncbi:biphenyl-2,3-diol 1,2-dioxygenase, variant, partial [Hesseltinella vesiculosa]
MAPTLKGFDHVVINVANIPRSCSWYEKMLGMKVQRFVSPTSPGQTRFGLKFGDQKINLHEANTTTTPVAMHPKLGSADLCFWTDQPVQQILDHWHAHYHSLLRPDDDPRLGRPIAFDDGHYIVNRAGANGALASIYIFDLDGNLLEVANRLH